MFVSEIDRVVTKKTINSIFTGRLETTLSPFGTVVYNFCHVFLTDLKLMSGLIHLTLKFVPCPPLRKRLYGRNFCSLSRQLPV